MIDNTRNGQSRGEEGGGGKVGKYYMVKTFVRGRFISYTFSEEFI